MNFLQFLQVKNLFKKTKPPFLGLFKIKAPLVFTKHLKKALQFFQYKTIIQK